MGQQRHAHSTYRGSFFASGSLCTLLWVAALLLTPPPSIADSPTAPTSDVRILIDLSGSMRQNDPHNLRAPALGLIVGLLPDGTYSGVWTFGKLVNMLVPWRKIDSKWRQQARRATKEIHSRGLFTNIEEVLRKSTWNWHEPDPAVNRNLILLTDGFVDIAKSESANNASRRRIITKILPRLQRAGVTIHTIALSSNADHELLRQLSTATNGWYKAVESADELERVFLKMWEQSTTVDTLPVAPDNTVEVDASVNEMTLLVFRKKHSGPASIVPPAGKEFHQYKLPENVSWYREGSYDLITVKNPTPGTWKINAEFDPDNRVMIVTDLKMRADKLPNNLNLQDSYLLTARLEEHGQVITRPEFHKFVKILVEQRHQDKVIAQWRMNDDGEDGDTRAQDGIYAARIGDSLKKGHYEFVVLADGITFQRIQRQSVDVHDGPVATQITPTDDPLKYTLIINAFADLIDIQSMSVKAVIEKPNGERERIKIPHHEGNEWRYTLSTEDFPGDRHRIELNISGLNHHGRPVNTWLQPLEYGFDKNRSIHVDTPEPPPQTEPPPAHAEHADDHQHESPDATDHHTADEAPAAEETPTTEEPRGKPNLYVTFLLVLLVNSVLIGGAFFAYRALRKSKAEIAEQLDEEAVNAG